MPKILVVDDEINLRKAYKRILRKYEVKEAEDGLEALERYPKQRARLPDNQGREQAHSGDNKHMRV